MTAIRPRAEIRPALVLTPEQAVWSHAGGVVPGLRALAQGRIHRKRVIHPEDSADPPSCRFPPTGAVNRSPESAARNGYSVGSKTPHKGALPGTLLSEYLPAGSPRPGAPRVGNRSSDTRKQIRRAATQSWNIGFSGTEGFQKAEVTRGGVDTRELSPKTLEARKVANLYFIGEVVDVTGHLGGHNFQWAWSSGYCAGQYA